jgi:prolyl-tRNA editing enzyme YbaK/EbsC (Cys-tRNA(Pro) deacylase)
VNEGLERVAEALAARGHPHASRWLDAAVLVIASGDRRVDERRVAGLTGALARADAAFVKQATGFSIGGAAPLGVCAPVTLIDRELFRFGEIWAAAGHPNGVFRLAPQDLARLTGGAPVADVVEAP